MEKYSPIIHEINDALEKFNSLFILKEHHVSLLDEKEFFNKLFFTNLTNTLWKDQLWPNGDKRGVYFLFGVNEKNSLESGLYIGKASLTSKIGIRLYTHLTGYRDSEHYFMNDGRGNRYILEMLTTISLEDKLVYMIPALEEFLIGELKEREMNLLNVYGNC